MLKKRIRMTQIYPSFDPSLKKNLGEFIVPDTSVLQLCFTDEIFFRFFLQFTEHSTILIDPTAKLEFLRGAYQEHLFTERSTFIEYNGFLKMMDHNQIHNLTYKKALDIARIYAHVGNPRIPLGDLLILARMSVYSVPCTFFTLDKEDFGTLLFDRLGIVTLVRQNKVRADYFTNMQILTVNKTKFDTCLRKLPQ